jgi:hypothetical protein
MNIQEYKRRLLELETRLSARMVRDGEHARAQVLDSAGDTADASVADLEASEDFTEAELDAPCCNRSATPFGGSRMARSAVALSTANRSTRSGSKPSLGRPIV